VSTVSSVVHPEVSAKPFDVEAVALDLDGTLLDTLPDIAEAANRMLAGLGRPRADLATVRSYIGDGIPRLTKRLLTGQRDGEPDPALFDRALPLFERHYRDTFTLTTQPFPGVLEGLERMRAGGLRLACVTNKAVTFSEPLLEATGVLRYLDLVLGGDSLPSKKPDPGPLLHVARKFGIPPDRLLVIGDSDNDSRAGRAAGCPVVLVSYGYTGERDVRDLDADAIVADLVEASSLIQSAQS
jgi:phosphoglycolate phosphatase